MAKRKGSKKVRKSPCKFTCKGEFFKHFIGRQPDSEKKPKADLSWHLPHMLYKVTLGRENMDIHDLFSENFCLYQYRMPVLGRENIVVYAFHRQILLSKPM